ncbi:hypothetical protein Ciccas_010221 [Cichlidogyrus casuarinus]|uniref:Tumour suppressor p53-binding protein-1 Tudor domain-containing protein n=1 Tax=Cichlidogyrus casuarinus TaxID=1844966 RepID=A0ABD2PVI1_9PLAT
MGTAVQSIFVKSYRPPSCSTSSSEIYLNRGLKQAVINCIKSKPALTRLSHIPSSPMDDTQILSSSPCRSSNFAEPRYTSKNHSSQLLLPQSSMSDKTQTSYLTATSSLQTKISLIQESETDFTDSARNSSRLLFVSETEDDSQKPQETLPPVLIQLTEDQTPPVEEILQVSMVEAPKEDTNDDSQKPQETLPLVLIQPTEEQTLPVKENLQVSMVESLKEEEEMITPKRKAARVKKSTPSSVDVMTTPRSTRSQRSKDLSKQDVMVTPRSTRSQWSKDLSKQEVLVYAKYRDGYYYPGKAISMLPNNQMKVHFDDGTREEFNFMDVVCVDLLPVDSQVSMRKASGQYWSDCTIIDHQDSGYLIRCNEGETNPIKALRSSVIISEADMQHLIGVSLVQNPVANVMLYESSAKKAMSSQISCENLVFGRRVTRNQTLPALDLSGSKRPLTGDSTPLKKQAKMDTSFSKIFQTTTDTESSQDPSIGSSKKKALKRLAEEKQPPATPKEFEKNALVSARKGAVKRASLSELKQNQEPGDSSSFLTVLRDLQIEGFPSRKLFHNWAFVITSGVNPCAQIFKPNKAFKFSPTDPLGSTSRLLAPNLLSLQEHISKIEYLISICGGRLIPSPSAVSPQIRVQNLS